MNDMKISGRCPKCDKPYGECRCHKRTLKEMEQEAKAAVRSMAEFLGHTPPTTPPENAPKSPAAAEGGTSETDAILASFTPENPKPYFHSAIALARRLERERNEARSEIADLKERIRNWGVDVTEQAVTKLREELALLRPAPTGQERELRELLKELSDAVIFDHEDKRGPDVFLARRADKCRAFLARPVSPKADMPTDGEMNP